MKNNKILKKISKKSKMKIKIYKKMNKIKIKSKKKDQFLMYNNYNHKIPQHQQTKEVSNLYLEILSIYLQIKVIKYFLIFFIETSNE